MYACVLVCEGAGTHVYTCVEVRGHRQVLFLKGYSFVSLGQSLAETLESRVR